MPNDLNTGSQYAYNFFQTIVSALPRIIGALVILLISYFIAKGIAGLIKLALNKANLNARLHTGKGGNIVQRAVPDPSNLVAKIAYWVIFIFGLSLAASFLGIPALVDFIRAIYAYLPNVLAAILIFLVAGAVSAGVVTLVTNTMGETPTGKVVATAAPIVVMGIAVFMILNQLKIAPAIVTITYAALIGSAALGLALAFGLGGRQVAATMLQDLYAKGQQNKGQVAADMRQGATSAKQQINKKRHDAQV